MQDRLIICIASNWNLDPTSKHHLMRIFSGGNDVVWVNYHGSRRPRLNRHDTGAALNALRRVASGVHAIGPRMVQFTPLVVPGAPGGVRDFLNRQALYRQIGRVVAKRRRHQDQPVQLWTFAPDVAFLAGAFGEECLVYYCVDDFSRFEGFDKEAVATAERRLISAADVVIASSARLHQHCATLHPRVHLVRHGVDHAHFARAARGQLPIPDPIRHVRRPMVGFIGLVHHWFDVELLRGVARRMPDVSFVIVGECVTDVSPLAALENVKFTGRQPYGSLPAYCAAFRAGLIPFVRTPMTDAVNPIKLREYLAAGLPVVTTGLPEVRGLGPDVTIGDDVEAFVAGCRRAIRRVSLLTRLATSESVADQGWEAVATRVSALVMDASRSSATTTTMGADVADRKSGPAAAFTSPPELRPARLVSR